MCLENKIVELTTAIATLTTAIAASSAVSTSTAKSETKTESADAKTETKGAAKGRSAAKSKPAKTETVDPEHTMAELKAALQDYKAIFGTPEAKKLLPSLGYSNSAAVPADKLDEVYDVVIGKIEAEAADGSDEEEDL